MFVDTFIGEGLVIDGQLRGLEEHAGAIGSMAVRPSLDTPGKAPPQLLDQASLFSPGTQIRPEPTLTALPVTDDRALRPPLAEPRQPWLPEAGDAIGWAVDDAACLLDLGAVVIDGSMGRDFLQALVMEVDSLLGRYDWEGVKRPRLSAGSVGSRCAGPGRRAVAAACRLRARPRSLSQNWPLDQASRFKDRPATQQRYDLLLRSDVGRQRLGRRCGGFARIPGRRSGPTGFVGAIEEWIGSRSATTSRTFRGLFDRSVGRTFHLARGHADFRILSVAGAARAQWPIVFEFDGFDLELALDELLDVADEPGVVACYQRDGQSRCTGPTGSANAVHIVLGGERQSE